MTDLSCEIFVYSEDYGRGREAVEACRAHLRHSLAPAMDRFGSFRLNGVTFDVRKNARATPSSDMPKDFLNYPVSIWAESATPDEDRFVQAVSRIGRVLIDGGARCVFSSDLEPVIMQRVHTKRTA